MASWHRSPASLKEKASTETGLSMPKQCYSISLPNLVSNPVFYSDTTHTQCCPTIASCIQHHRYRSLPYKAHLSENFAFCGSICKNLKIVPPISTISRLLETYSPVVIIMYNYCNTILALCRLRLALGPIDNP